MNKLKLLSSLDELTKGLQSKKAKRAIEILKNEIELVSQAELPPRYNDMKVDSLPLPGEILGNRARMALFTDGACRGNPGPGSWAYLAQNCQGEHVTKRAACEEYTTNNKMELKAIIFGLKDLLMSSPGLEIWVYTDSKYVVEGMKSWVAGWKKRGWKKADNKAPENLELWQQLDELNSKARIVFNWVKGHAGHPQNEFVDQMANKELDANGF